MCCVECVEAVDSVTDVVGSVAIIATIVLFYVQCPLNSLYSIPNANQRDLIQHTFASSSLVYLLA
jgi:hypothetical protein